MWGVAAQNISFSIPPFGYHLPILGQISRGTMAADLPSALELTAGPLGEVLDLIWPEPPQLNHGGSSTFALDSFHRNAPFGLHGLPEAFFGNPRPGVGGGQVGWLKKSLWPWPHEDNPPATFQIDRPRPDLPFPTQWLAIIWLSKRID